MLVGGRKAHCFPLCLVQLSVPFVKYGCLRPALPAVGCLVDGVTYGLPMCCCGLFCLTKVAAGDITQFA